MRILAAAAQTLLRRDMSLNRRLYAWLLGTAEHTRPEAQGHLPGGLGSETSIDGHVSESSRVPVALGGWVPPCPPHAA